MHIGTSVEVSPVSGPGFRIETAAPEEAPQVFMFATGSGISPIKALIESGALQVPSSPDSFCLFSSNKFESSSVLLLVRRFEAGLSSILSSIRARGQ